MDTRICAGCNTPYARTHKQTDAQWHARLYCGRPCAAISRRGIKGRRQSPEEIARRAAANRRPVALRFEKYTIPEPNSGCLLWLGSVDRRGYGQLRVDDRLRPASHIALELAGRPVPPGLCALHKCDNPLCCEATHLFIGTQRDNVRDATAKGRMDLSGLALGRMRKEGRTHCVNGHALTGNNAIRHIYGWIECRTCRQAKRRLYRINRKLRGLPYA